MKQTWKVKDEGNGNSLRARPYNPGDPVKGGVLFNMTGQVDFILAGVLVPYDKALKLHRRLGEWLDDAAPDEAEVVG